MSNTLGNQDIVRGREGNLAKDHVANRYLYDAFLPRYRNKYAGSRNKDKRPLCLEMLGGLAADGFRWVIREDNLWIEIESDEIKVDMLMHCMRDRLRKGLLNDPPQPVQAPIQAEDRPQDGHQDGPEAVGFAFHPNLQPLPVLHSAQVENREALRAYDSHQHLRGNQNDQQMIAVSHAAVVPFQASQRHQADTISNSSSSSSSGNLILPAVNPALLPIQQAEPVEVVNQEPLRRQGDIDPMFALGSREFLAPFDAAQHFPDANDQELEDNNIAGSRYSAVFQEEDVASIFDDPDFDPREIPLDDTETILDNDHELLVENLAALFDADKHLLCDADQHFHDA